MFLILETIVNETASVTLADTTETRDEAESVYYGILSKAAKSKNQWHGAVILDRDSTPVMHKSYEHEVN